MKQCKTCLKTKPLEEFYAHPTAGRQPHCSECDRARQKSWYERNKAHAAARQRAYREKNRAAVNESLRRYYRDNAEELKRKKKLRYNENPEKFKKQTRGVKLKAQYGLTADGYEALVQAQEGCCALCGRAEKEKFRNLSVDHCHSTGKVRALLCRNCNSGLGHFKDNPSLLRLAASYVEKHAGEENYPRLAVG